MTTFYSVKSTKKHSNFVVLETSLLASQSNINLDYSRNLSVFGSNSYIRSLRRAFSHVKYLVFFNKDLNTFVTLTYKGLPLLDQVINDIKTLVRNHNRSNKKKLKYIYILEIQKRGSIHVHMICNNVLKIQKNRNNYYSVTDWKKGFSSVLTIKDFDNNFKPYIYLFKYMKKTQRVGNSFIHTSRNFDKICNYDYNDYINKINQENLLFREDFEVYVDGKEHRVIKKYYKQKENKSHGCN